ncbi:MAG: hypothetical protein EOO53_11815 [Gammaproteobacteria bacterium]|nr:MAG: hypothetical protein EOO53_11815 [Gammaproteobacteria bacterium]
MAYETLETYITEVLLRENDGTIMDELSGVMAETNAEFSDFPEYDEVEIEETDLSVVVTVNGVYSGDNVDDKPFSGDTIDFEATVILTRVAGRRAFSDYELSAGGGVRDDWSDFFSGEED